VGPTHREHNLAQTAVGVAAVAGATYVAAKAAYNYIGDSHKRYWGVMWTVSAIFFVILILPWIVLPAVDGEAGFLFFTLPFLLLLGFSWRGALNDPRGKRPAGPIHAECDRGRRELVRVQWPDGSWTSGTDDWR
jgi:hypothetical protein